MERYLEHFSQKPIFFPNLRSPWEQHRADIHLLSCAVVFGDFKTIPVMSLTTDITLSIQKKEPERKYNFSFRLPLRYGGLAAFQPFRLHPVKLGKPYQQEAENTLLAQR